MENCIFCKIINKEIPANIVFESDNLLAFKDLNPVAPIHILFIPKKHISSLDSMGLEDKSLLGELLYEISNYAKSIGLPENGYRVVNNMGKEAGQTVFHIHFHLIAGRKMKWPPG
jgi:histidine triad (HIT) family protein